MTTSLPASVSSLAKALLFGAVFALATSAAHAQAAKEYNPDFPDRSRDALELPDELRPDVDRPLVADTVVTFTNSSRRRNIVGCTAIDNDGQKAGSSRIELPPYGVRFFRTSDLAGAPFVGSLLCKSVEPSRAVAVFVGPGFTDLPVHHSRGSDLLIVRVPLAAAY